ncbi:hypothetical protein BSKO_07956 [Bryopsis sp. KO-2023]|nr:hypothetical protein BSKO_07956 [Bryopsis sp. KO-2023]
MVSEVVPTGCGVLSQLPGPQSRSSSCDQILAAKMKPLAKRSLCEPATKKELASGDVCRRASAPHCAVECKGDPAKEAPASIIDVSDAGCISCRTLLIRKVDPAVEESELNGLLASRGRVHSLDVERREEGLVRIVFHDLRSADKAKGELEGHSLGGSALALEYSTDAEADELDEEARVVVRVEPHLGPQELIHIFSTYGDVRAVQDLPNVEGEKLIEFYDLRDAQKAVNALNRVDGDEAQLPQSNAFVQAITVAQLRTKSDKVLLPGRKSNAAVEASFAATSATGSETTATTTSSRGVKSMVATVREEVEEGYGDVRGCDYDVADIRLVGDLPFWGHTGSFLASGIKQSDSVSSFLAQPTVDLSNCMNSQVRSNNVWGSCNALDSRASCASTQSSASSVEFPGSKGSLPSESLFSSCFGAGDSFQKLTDPQSDWSRVQNFQPSMFSNFSSGDGSLGRPGSFGSTACHQDDSVDVNGWPVGDNEAKLNDMKRDLPVGLGLYDGDCDPHLSSLGKDDTSDAYGLGCQGESVEESYHANGGIPMGCDVGDQGAYFDQVSPCGMAAQAAGFGGCAMPQINPMMVGAHMGFGHEASFLGQYYQTINHAAIIQQAVEKEVLKRLAFMTVDCNGGGGGRRGDRSAESMEQKDSGFGGAGWGGCDKNGRRRGSRFGKKGSGGGADHGGETDKRAQQQRMFALDMTRIRSGHDKRTTLMVKNIPNKYTQKMLLQTIEEECPGTFDFFYLPIDFKNRCNVGYGFINMMCPENIISFVEKFNQKRWEKFNSEKVCCVTYARIQGRAALINHFQNSSLMQEDSKHRPLLFTPDGQPELFPTQPLT